MIAYFLNHNLPSIEINLSNPNSSQLKQIPKILFVYFKKEKSSWIWQYFIQIVALAVSISNILSVFVIVKLEAHSNRTDAAWIDKKLNNYVCEISIKLKDL